MEKSINLDTRAADCVFEAAYGMEELDLDALRDAVQNQIASRTESACIYYSSCLKIIDRYESDDRADPDALGDEGAHKPSQWRDAMSAYAYAIAYTVIGCEAENLLSELEHCQSVLAHAGAPDVGVAPRLSRSCPHGWAPHDREDSDGVYYWRPAELEGCHAIAIRAECGLWLSYTWTPTARVSR
jgi:hypothetical protein